VTNNALPARKSHRTHADHVITDRIVALACLTAFGCLTVAAPALLAPSVVLAQDSDDTDVASDPSAGLSDPTTATPEPDGSPETLGTLSGDGEGEDEARTAEEEEEDEEAREEAADDATEDASEEVSDEDESIEERIEGAMEAQAENEPLAWRNSFFTWTQGLTFNTLVRDGQQTYNPTYYWSFGLLPRWYLDARLFLIASVGVSYELTDSDGDTFNHELALSDALVELRYTAVVDRFVFIPAIRLTVPTSKASQAAQRYFNTGIGLTSVLQIPEFLSSNIALGLSYRRWWAGSNVSLAQNPYPGGEAFGSRFGASGAFDATSGDVGSTFTSGMGGAANAVDRLLVALTFNVTPVSGLTLTLQGLMVFDRADDLAAGSLGCENILTTPCGSTHEVPFDPNQSRWRAFTYFTLAAAYDVQPWLNLQLGVANSAVIAPLYNDDGSVRSPFNPDSQVYLSATVTLDGIYQAITAGGEDDGLTPEQRQRRRQGLASLELDESRDLEGSAHEDEEALNTRTLVGF